MKKPVRICMIGAGRVGKNHSRALTRVAGGEIVALRPPGRGPACRFSARRAGRSVRGERE